VALKTTQQYSYKTTELQQTPIHFEVRSFLLDTKCSALEEQQSPHFNIFWIEEGSGTYQIDFQSFTIKNGGIFFLSPGQVFQVESEQVKSGYQISFDKEFYCVETHGKEIACNGVLFNNVHRAAAIQLADNDIPVFKQIMQNMIQEFENPGPAHREMLETYLRMFLIQSLRKLDELQVPLEKTTDEGNRLVSDFIALIEKHYRKIHSVAEYAELLFISPKSLAKRLKALNYNTPTELIRDRIMLQAKRDLRYSNRSIKEIAFDLGFDDPAYFTRLFKKAVQQSPQAYRSAFK